MEKYEVVKDLGAGNFGVAQLLRHKDTKELVAMKYIERGHKIDENVAREIINHKSLRHPNIIRFKEVVLTPTHLAIVMEYAAGGELFDRICSAGRFSENEVRHRLRKDHGIEGGIPVVLSLEKPKAKLLPFSGQSGEEDNPSDYQVRMLASYFCSFKVLCLLT
ncbi:serine/threonine-protein kinase SRK2G [Gossypium raimondii]|uniref:non-specific serine/threonine protein kinase n=1 Tax=Gossypium raimondii TaxID=29730 RepID=A0A0D2PX87_GOSRA|nr:serine/threonine-protein kinase SRK2G [Gossypium raimondii]KJB08866.1 hypothetical protein B456_001G109600 [Gossypium raimondii]